MDDKARRSELLRQATEAYNKFDTWADYSNYLFSPDIGIVAAAYQSKEERAAFVDSVEYVAIKQLLAKKREQTGLVAGANPKIPRS